MFDNKYYNYISLLVEAYENEITLDKDIKIRLNLDSDYPNFKVLKLDSLVKKYGINIINVLKVYIILKIILSPFIWIFTLLISCFYKKYPVKKYIYITNNSNLKLVRDAIGSNIPILPTSIIDLSKHLSLIENLQSIILHLFFLIHVYTKRINEDFVYHLNDSFKLSKYIVYIKNRKLSIVTDDHYQRWSYIFSHICEKLDIVQHGYISEIEFPHRYGRVHYLYIRDFKYYKQFKIYYRITKYEIFTSYIDLCDLKINKFILLLCSSSPFIEYEINFLKQLKSIKNIYIVVKLHPSHIYNNKLSELKNNSHMLINNDSYPKCNIFICYKSFIIHDYINRGITSFSIFEEGSVKNTIIKVMEKINE